MRERIPSVHRMEGDFRSNSPSPSSHAEESSSPPVEHHPWPTKYHSFGGHGGIRHESDNPSRLYRHRYPYPQHVSRAAMGRTSTNDLRYPAVMDDHPITRQEGFHDQIEEDIDDYPMTTSDESRNPSFAELESHQRMSAATFGGPSIMPSRYPPSTQPSIPYVPINTYEAFDPFSGPRPPNNGNLFLPSPFTAHDSGDRNQMRNPAPTNRAPSQSQQVSPSLSLPDASTVTTNSMNSSSTIRRVLTVQEQRYFLVNTLYNACLDASMSYLSSLRRHHRLSNRRYHPYFTLPYQPHKRQPSLMDNLSVICTHMWQKARNDGMAPHRAEAAAVKMMRDLYAWGEVVVRSFERGMDEESESEWWGVEDSPAVKVDEAARIGEAAKSLCSSLKDTQAWSECENVVRELRDLENRDMVSEDGYGIV